MKEIRLIVLYGSFARGDYGKKSDIDIFILIEKNHGTKEKTEDIIIRNSKYSERRIIPVIRTLDELKSVDEGFLDNIFREGKVLYSKFFDIDVSEILKLKPYIIYSFDLRNMNQNKKRKFNFALYGQRVKKYTYKGILERVDGKKLSKGCILIPENRKNEIEDLFNTYRIKPESVRIWGF